MLKGYGQVRASKWPIVAVESATVKDETGHIGHQIRQVREQRGVSREKLAVKTGVSVTVIRRIETRNEGGRKSVDILRRELGIDRDGHILADAEPPPAYVPEDYLPHVSDAALWAEMQRRWHDREAEIERLRARTGTPLGVTTPVPPHLLHGPVARNAIASDKPDHPAESPTRST